MAELTHFQVSVFHYCAMSIKRTLLGIYRQIPKSNDVFSV